MRTLKDIAETNPDTWRTSMRKNVMDGANEDEDCGVASQDRILEQALYKLDAKGVCVCVYAK